MTDIRLNIRIDTKQRAALARVAKRAGLKPTHLVRMLIEASCAKMPRFALARVAHFLETEKGTQ